MILFKSLALGCAVGLALAVPATFAPVFFSAVEVFVVAGALTLELATAAPVMLDAARVLFDDVRVLFDDVRVQFDAPIVLFDAEFVLFDVASVELHAAWWL